MTLYFILASLRHFTEETLERFEAKLRSPNSKMDSEILLEILTDLR
ncbi:unnamed protein product, partial [Allacma fusca]